MEGALHVGPGVPFVEEHGQPVPPERLASFPVDVQATEDGHNLLDAGGIRNVLDRLTEEA